MQLIALRHIDEVLPGTDLIQLLVHAIQKQDLKLEQGDIIVLAQKIVSKAENRYVSLDTVQVTEGAAQLAMEVDKDPRLVQLILDQSCEIVRKKPGVLIVENHRGYVHANAGIDRSNLPASTDASESVLLLPKNADDSARQLMLGLSAHAGCDIGVIINDSAGRAWREGTLGFAIGTAGFNPLIDLIGKKDRNGRIMEMTQVAVADELAAAASYLMGQADEGLPVILIRGAKPMLGDYDSQRLLRPKQTDLFR